MMSSRARCFLILSIVVVAGGCLLFSAVADANNDIVKTECGNGPKTTKITICHYPPGNHDNPQIIRVGISAVTKHIEQHGDTCFKCEEPEPPVTSI